MIALIAGVLVVLLVGVAVLGGAAGVAGVGRHGRHEGTGLAAALAVPAAVTGVIVVLLALAVFGLGAARSGRGADPAEGGDAAERAESPPPPPSLDSSAEDDALALVGPAATYDGRVTLDAGRSPLRPLPVVAGVREGDLVEVLGRGFVGGYEGVLAQCERADSERCRNVVPVLTDREGRLRVPYRLEPSTSGEVLVAEVDLDRGAARLVFGAPSARAILEVRAGTRVSVRDAVPGEGVSLRRCRPEVTRLGDCETVGRSTVGRDGTASFRTTGSRADGALLTLVGSDGEVVAEPVRLTSPARAPSVVELSSWRLLVGFGLAILLLAAAVFLIRTTEWRAPAEAATPFLDAAPLER